MSGQQDGNLLRELIERVVNLDASADQIAELEQRLLADPAARDRYLDYVNLHSALRRRFLAGHLSVQDLQSGPIECGCRDSEPIECGPVAYGRVSPGAMESGPLAHGPALAAESLAASSLDPRMAVSGGWSTWMVRIAVSLAALVLIGFFAWPRFGASQGGRASAVIREVKGEVTILSDAASSDARVGDSLRPGDRLRTGAEESLAILEYADGTQVRIHGDSVVHAWANRDVILQLLSGSMEVDAAPQPADRPLIFGTSHSRCVVLGTKFRLYRDASATRLELAEGKVRLVRPDGGESVEVQAGSVAIATNEGVPVEIEPLSPGRAQPQKSLSKAGQSVAFFSSPQGDFLVTSHADRGLKVWDAKSFRRLSAYAGDAGLSDGLAVSPDGRTVVQLNRQGYALLWRWDESEARSVPLNCDNARCRALSPDGLFIAQAHGADVDVLSLDLDLGGLTPVAQLQQSGKASCLALSRMGTRLAAGFSGGTLRVYDVATLAVVFERKLADTPAHVALSDDGWHVAVYTHNDGLKLIDLTTGVQQPLWPPGSERVRCLRFTPDGTRLLSGMNDQTARVWAVADGRSLLVVDVAHSFAGIAWSEERRLLAAGAGSVKLWKCSFGSKAPEESWPQSP